MELSKLLGEQQSRTPANFNDPFNKNSVDSINIHMRHGIFDESKIEWSASISFRNGSTEGKQRFDDCATLGEVLTKMQQFAQNLK